MAPQQPRPAESKKYLRLAGGRRRPGYQALVENDRHQLSDPEACRAIRDSDLYHVRDEQDIARAK